MLKFGRFLGALMFAIGIIGALCSALGLIYVIIKSSYELRIFFITFNNPDVNLLVSTILFFLAGMFGASVFNRYDLLLVINKHKKNHEK